MSVHEILSLNTCAMTQTSLHTFKVSPECSCTDTYIHEDIGMAATLVMWPDFYVSHLKESPFKLSCLLDFLCPSIQFYLLLSPYLSFISFLYLNLYVLGDDALN